MSVKEFQRLLRADDSLIAPGVFDGLTTTIVERIGFDTCCMGGWTTGASTAITELIITSTEMCDRASEVVENTDLPVRQGRHRRHSHRRSGVPEASPLSRRPETRGDKAHRRQGGDGTQGRGGGPIQGRPQRGYRPGRPL